MKGAAKVTYRQASEMNTPIKEIAPYSGLRCATIETAHPIAMPANKMKSSTNICSCLWPVSVFFCASLVNQSRLQQKDREPQSCTESYPNQPVESFMYLLTKSNRPDHSIVAVITMLMIAAGTRNFQPKLIN